MRFGHSLSLSITTLLFTATWATAQVGNVLEVRMPIEPSPVPAEGQVHLAYELHVTNLSRRDATLTGVQAVVTDRGTALATHEGVELARQLRIAGSGDVPTNDHGVALDAGATAHVYMWLSVEPRATPSSITHRIRLFQVSAEGDTTHHEFETDPLGIGPDAVVISPPVRGGDWWIVDGQGRRFNDTGHRRALIAVGGNAHIAQRFARDLGKEVDGIALVPGGVGNAAFYGWGQEVVAVADGVVVGIQDGVPENEFGVPSPIQLTPRPLLGNSVVLDIGDGRYAVYGHLQPGNMRIEVGNRVQTGDALGLVGNSGSSSGPHLHFQITDDPSPLGGEGLPFAIDRFDVIGRRMGFQTPRETLPSERREGELLVENQIVRFPGG
ncbi:MAG: M23 family metallopeptidase [Gemmatimonadota bacterium]